jgi:O-antigen/teichoic acid export membrane protein
MIQFFSLWVQRYKHLNWTVADQIMVSGFNFMTGILLGRFLGVEGYGQFVLLYTVLLYVNIFQYSLILAPMMSIAPQASSDVEQINYFKGMITLQFLLSLFLSLIVVVLGSGIEKWLPSWNLQNNVLPLALSILFFQLQDWLRRYYFVRGKGKAVFINDFVSYGGQVALLVVFYWWGRLNITNTFWALAVSSAIAFLIGAMLENIRPSWNSALQVFQQSWQSGRDLLLAGQINWVGSQGILLFGASILGAKAAGGIRAAQNIVGPFNILFQAMENIIPIQAAQHYATKQLTGLTNYLKKVTLVGSLLLAIPCVILAVFSRELMQFTYGKEYTVFSALIVWQIVIVLLGFLRTQAFYFYRTIRSTKIIVFNTIIASVVTFLFTAVFGQSWQEIGIMLALLMGQAVSLIFLMVTIYKYLINFKIN